VIQNILTASFLRRLSAIDNVMIELPMLGLLLFMGLRWSSLPLSLGTVALMAAYGLIAVILLVFFGRLEAHFQAARHVAGDFYDVFELPYSKQIALVIADVCDKGVGAALFMALFRSLIRVLSGSYDGAQPVKGPSSGSHPEDTLLRTIRSINTYIARTHERESMFATIFFGILNPHTGDIHYINAGHEPPIVIGACALKATLSPTGPAVGLFESLDFKVGEIQLEPGHILLAYTDGVTDAQDEAGRAFGKEQLFSAAVSSYASVEELVHQIRGLLTKHTRGQDQFDDITLLALRRKPTS
jgi:sigma-B regulation protein RsbU (phosphoserine phosphatase)